MMGSVTIKIIQADVSDNTVIKPPPPILPSPANEMRDNNQQEPEVANNPSETIYGALNLPTASTNDQPIEQANIEIKHDNSTINYNTGNVPHTNQVGITPSDPGILGILSDLSVVFSGGEDDAQATGESGVVLVTPTKKIVTLVKSPEKSAISPSKYCKIAAAKASSPGRIPLFTCYLVFTGVWCDISH